MPNIQIPSLPQGKLTARKIITWVAGIAVTLVIAYGYESYFSAPVRDPYAPVPVISGIPAPDASCLPITGSIPAEWWVTGRWVGYLDGQPSDIDAVQAWRLASAGHLLYASWICPPVIFPRPA